MKNKIIFKVIIIMIIVAVTSTIGVFYYNDRNSVKAINIDEVKSVSLYPSRAGYSPDVCNYNFKNSDDMKVVNNVVNYFNVGNTEGIEESVGVSMGMVPARFVLELTDGQHIEISAFDNQVDSDQVLIAQSNGRKIYKFYAPELRKLYTDELKRLFNQ